MGLLGGVKEGVEGWFEREERKQAALEKQQFLPELEIAKSQALTNSLGNAAANMHGLTIGQASGLPNSSQLSSALLQQFAAKIAAQQGLQTTSTPPPEPQDPNKIPALAASIQNLIDLWNTRWPEQWVSRETIDADDFWEKAFYRLQRLSLFEEVSLRGTSYANVMWYRLRDS